MAYEKQNWENTPSKTTPISASRLNHMEDGIGNALTEHQQLKTINNQSILGEGNIDIEGGEGSGAVIIDSGDSEDIVNTKLLSCVEGTKIIKPCFIKIHGKFYTLSYLGGEIRGRTFHFVSLTEDVVNGIVLTMLDGRVTNQQEYNYAINENQVAIIYSDDSDETKINKFKSCLKETGDSNVYEMIKPCFIYDNGKLTPIDMFSFSNGVYAFSYKIYYSDAIVTMGLLFEEEGTTITEKESISPNSNYIINDSTSDKDKIEIIAKNSNVKWRIGTDVYESVYNDTITRDMYKETTIKYARYNPENDIIESFDVVYRKDSISPTESTETITRSEVKTLNLSNSPVIIYETDSESVISQKLLSCISLDEYNYPRLVKPCKIFGETDVGTFSYETTGVKRKNGNIEFQFKMEQVVLESDEPLLYISIMKIITDTNGNIIDNQRKIYASALQELE